MSVRFQSEMEIQMGDVILAMSIFVCESIHKAVLAVEVL